MTAQENSSPSPASRRFPVAAHLLALVAAVLCWLLLLSGGQVTTYRVGMAVPDWPTTFGANMFLYNMWTADWGSYIEHRHRLFGATLGFAAIGLAAACLFGTSRRWLKVAGLGALGAVIVQGLLGGYRVKLVSTVLAAVHGCSAQAVFGFLVALCVWTGRGWANGEGTTPDVGHFRRRALVTLVMIYAQIVVGAVLRHYGEGLSAHALLAVAVWAHALALSIRIERRRDEVPSLVSASRAMAVLVTLQIALGIAAWWLLRPFDGVTRPVSVVSANIRTGHLANGSLLLASAVVLTLRAYRSLSPVAATVSPTPSPRLEVVA